MKVLCRIVLSVFSIMIMACATSIPVTVERPSELDLGGAESISLIPFRTSDFSMDGNFFDISFNFGNFYTNSNKAEKQIAEYLSYELTKKLSTSEYYKIISPTAVESALNNGKKAPVDVYLTGSIKTFSDELKSKDKTLVIKDEKVIKTYFYREVNLTLNYEVVNAKNNQLIAYKTAPVNCTSSQYEEKEDVPGAFDLVKTDLDDLITRIYNQVHPYEESVYVELLNDKNKSPVMKAADNLAKQGDITGAKEEFSKIYDSTSLFEAGFNSAQLSFVLGDWEEAYALMEELANSTSDKRAIRALQNIKYEIQSAKRLKEQTKILEININKK